MFDYGKEGNQKQYGTVSQLPPTVAAIDLCFFISQDSPPEYNVSALNVPTVLFTGTKDWLADRQDVATLVPKIAHTVIKHVNLPSYDHLDFIWGLDAHTKVYKPIVDIANCCIRQNGNCTGCA